MITVLNEIGSLDRRISRITRTEQKMQELATQLVEAKQNDAKALALEMKVCAISNSF
jgi:hypothetical protein